ncbi:hypothetical protein IAT40_005879 [Kwoniella sp. CBS 6097]
MSRRTTDYDRPNPKPGMGGLIAVGLTAGLLGVAVMSAGEKVEQSLTKRPNSHVPGLTLARLLGRPDAEKEKLNLIMHYGQTFENLVGSGALPWTWPVNEQVIDILHKGVFAFATGYICDAWFQ